MAPTAPTATVKLIEGLCDHSEEFPPGLVLNLCDILEQLNVRYSTWLALKTSSKIMWRGYILLLLSLGSANAFQWFGSDGAISSELADLPLPEPTVLELGVGSLDRRSPDPEPNPNPDPAVVDAPVTALPTASQYPTETTDWLETTLVNGQKTWVPVVFTQTFAAVPDQWPGPAEGGSIGMGTLTGQIGVVRTSLPQQSDGDSIDKQGWLVGEAGAVGMMLGGLLFA
ncbi:hypothetical protein P152DRAFT_471836 [Eremomyces bilateralis CBS 781.70]|uniref:Uncharacterized protein n=1 Tax=Eremomyces bilateralis CBS 781.70 TaxID=1392243 RepID=A0A6G1GAU3_9PEZI|nr:uncharacterized protein P152DRAFT_471836 [Eremomyces bilateralis CBS 781.70]KAF1815217.1 hypothetical protein P152DRAFT_471836 [Eremomyces bilateralis CBS 781.70]